MTNEEASQIVREMSHDQRAALSHLLWAAVESDSVATLASDIDAIIANQGDGSRYLGSGRVIMPLTLWTEMAQNATHIESVREDLCDE